MLTKNPNLYLVLLWSYVRWFECAACVLDWCEELKLTPQLAAEATLREGNVVTSSLSATEGTALSGDRSQSIVTADKDPESPLRRKKALKREKDRKKKKDKERMAMGKVSGVEQFKPDPGADAPDKTLEQEGQSAVSSVVASTMFSDSGTGAFDFNSLRKLVEDMISKGELGNFVSMKRGASWADEVDDDLSALSKHTSTAHPRSPEPTETHSTPAHSNHPLSSQATGATTKPLTKTEYINSLQSWR
ncbi:hypothetical protein QFC19_008207 [Naganishia cerealis]|uniref:Uncharacterized protein n=1 Tax=Naganishia cerealis TaxID=610337 RepID=A0ACC2V3S4_9TREE|nr:hypothetical protein QFC19_008207 [Naganishia cerealis]